MYKVKSHCSSALGLLAVICISTAASLAQTPKESIDPFAVLPASDALIVLDLKRFSSDVIPRLLVDDPDARALVIASADPKTIDLLDPRAIQRLVAGFRYTTQQNEKTPSDFAVVAIAQSSEAGQLPALIRSRGSGKYREQQYGGKTLFITKVEQPGPASQATMATGSDEWAIVALDAKTLVFGDPIYVRSSIDLTTGKGKTVSAELVTAAKRNPNALFSAAGALPPSSMFGGQQFTNTDLGHMLSSLKQFDASVEPIPPGWKVAVTLTTTSPEQTKSLVDVLAAFKTLFVSVGPTKTKQEKVARDLIKGVMISSEGSEVKIRNEIPQASVNELAKQYGARMYFNQGVAHGLKGEPEAAIAEYEKSIRLDPDNASVFVNRGKARATKGDLDNAVVDYDKAISMDPDYALAYNNRCFAQLKKENFDAAIVDCGKAIALEPTFAYAYNNRGLAFASQGKLDKAMPDYDKSIALDGENIFAYQNRGDARLKTGNWDGAVADFEKCISIDAKSAEAYNGRGVALYTKKNQTGQLLISTAPSRSIRWPLFTSTEA
jgi:Flp pilus assembly protein TadD